MKLVKVIGQLLILVSVCWAGLLMADDAEDIKSRIEPVGKTCMTGEPCAAAPVAVVTGPKSGKEVYDGFCTTCHAAGVMNAPKFGNAADWAPRIAKGKDTLYSHAMSGFNSMPAKGMCAACSDDEVKAAVDFMTNSSK